MTIFFWLISLLIISFFLNRAWSGLLKGGWYALFLFPGIVVHELSHLLVCFFTGAPVSSFSLFSRQGGYVKHGKSKIPLIGGALISAAPITGGITALWLAAKYLDISLYTSDFFQTARGIFSGWSDGWTFWLFIYLAITITICLAPSKQDVKNSFGGLIVLLIVVYFLRFSILVDVLILGSVIGLIALIATIPLIIVKALLN